MSDDFPKAVKDQLGARVGWVCSNPYCQRPTSGPSQTAKATTNIGEAAHITAASPGGARYDPSLKSEMRRSAANGIWLCGTCAKMVDDDAVTYSVELLRKWKADAEARAHQDIECGRRPSPPQQIITAVHLGPNAISISGSNAVVLGPNAITINGPQVSASVGQGTLSEEAKALLVAASDDPTGMLYADEMLHGYSVQANTIEFVEPRSPRLEARWRSVVRELLSHRFIEPRNPKGDVLAVTEKGFKIADDVRSQMPAA